MNVPGLIRGYELTVPGNLLPKVLEHHCVRPVGFSELDVNGHMNNSKYIDETEDLLGAQYLKNHELRSLEIEYKSEIKLGQIVTLKYTKNDDDLSLVGIVEGNPCFELVAKFAPIRR